MYGVVLLAALSSGSATPAWGGRLGHHGCWGGQAVSYGCYGSGCYGGVPVGYGCCGGVSVSSGCYGSVAFGSGCYGSGYYAAPVSYGCCGGTTAFYGSSCYGGSPAPALPPAAPQATPAEEDGGDLPVASLRPAARRRLPASAPAPRVVRKAEPRPLPASPEPPRVARKAEPEPAADSPDTEQIGAPEDEQAPATIVVTLPAGAKLTINRTPSRSTAVKRRFVTPPLKPGQDFYYTLKAEMVRDGRPVTTTARVPVRAGEERRVKLTFPPAESVTQR
jgi:uncharacterized protein (TIGR03000 family)